MNTKAQKFQEYLNAKGQSQAFVSQDINNDFHTTVFRSNITVDDKSLPLIIVFDDSTYCMMQVQVADAVCNEANELKVLKTINSWNANYKVFKYMLDQNNNLILNSCLLNKVNEADGDKTYAVLDVMVQHLTKEYKNMIEALQ